MLFIKYKTVANMIIASALLAALSACSTSNPKIATRYEKKAPPEYQLVDTRFGTGNVQTTLAVDPLQREIMYVLYKLGCEVEVRNQEGVAKIQFHRPEAEGKITIDTRTTAYAAKELSRYKYTYRVNIVDYPATAEQDHHVNLIANELAATLKNNDMLQRTVCDMR
jgi:hypothetical protein